MTFSEWWKANKYRMLGKVWTEDACRETWQAAERQALERAAQRAEEKSMDCHTLGNAEEFRELAACIRALIEGASSDKEGS